MQKFWAEREQTQTNDNSTITYQEQQIPQLMESTAARQAPTNRRKSPHPSS